MSYIIDFERLNQLSTHPNDKIDGSITGTNLPHGISRSIIKQYLETYNRLTIDNIRSELSDRESKKLQMIIDTLEYNGILVDKRDKKIDQVLG